MKPRNIKPRNIKLLTVFTLLLMAGCTEDALDEGRGQMPISLTATVECDSDAVYTRAGTGVLNSFANGDAIKVYFPSNVRVGSTTSASSTTYSYNGSSWSPATQPYFNAGTSSCTVHAYYPSSHTNSTSSFSVQQDQSGDANYKSSDLMYATATITKSSPSGSLTFAHRMAKIIVNATAGAGVSTITGVRIIGGYRTINISTPQSCTLGTTLSNALSTSSYITMYSGGSSGSASCAAMIPPQSISGSFLQVVTNQGTATYSLASAKSFASGKSYQLNITVNAAAVGTTNSIPSWTEAGDVSVNASPWTVAVSGTYTYSGSAIVPAAGNITVTPVGGSTPPIPSSKYSVYCENNTNVGTAKLLVYGKDEHFGKFAETTFTISYQLMSTAQSADVGKVICSNGHIHNNVSDIDCGASASGIIAYVNSNGSASTSCPDVGGSYRGLAIALNDCTVGANSYGGYQWYTSNSGSCTTQSTDLTTVLSRYDGLSKTNSLVATSGTCANHTHAAADAARAFSTVRPSGVSAWFLPSLGQWNLMTKALVAQGGGKAADFIRSYNQNMNGTAVSKAILLAGGTGLSYGYLSSSEYDTETVWYVYFNYGGVYSTSKSSSEYKVRPCFAF